MDIQILQAIPKISAIPLRNPKGTGDFQSSVTKFKWLRRSRHADVISPKLLIIFRLPICFYAEFPAYFTDTLILRDVSRWFSDTPSVRLLLSLTFPTLFSALRISGDCTGSVRGRGAPDMWMSKKSAERGRRHRESCTDLCKPAAPELWEFVGWILHACSR